MTVKMTKRKAEGDGGGRGARRLLLRASRLSLGQDLFVAGLVMIMTAAIYGSGNLDVTHVWVIVVGSVLAIVGAFLAAKEYFRP